MAEAADEWTVREISSYFSLAAEEHGVLTVDVPFQLTMMP